MKKNIILARNILRNWVAYTFGFPPPIPIGYVIISTTYACNAKCRMCNLHEYYQEYPELSGKEFNLLQMLDRIKESRILRSIRHIDLTGGEPFLRNDLKQFINGLFALPAIDQISINTNGMLTNKIVEDVAEIVEGLKNYQHFSLSISIDGIGSLHDSIRGVPGAFDRVEKTVARLSAIQKRDSRFSLRSNSVIQPANLHYLDGIRKYWEKHGIAGSFGVIQTPFYTHTSGQKSYNDIRQFTKEDLAVVKAAMPKSRGMNTYLDNGCRRPLHCFAGYSAMCIDPFGTIYPCNFLTGNEEYSIGSIKDKGIDNLWDSRFAWNVRDKVKICPFTQCWNGCEVDQTMIQFEPINMALRASSCGLLSFYELKGFPNFQ
jgi:Fe-coproporphyrin III synthase